tara:strand:- start:171 stop:347 length:177 start_codon:yes stop_codon:yes gene_type:complete
MTELRPRLKYIIYLFIPRHVLATLGVILDELLAEAATSYIYIINWYQSLKPLTLTDMA